MKDFDNVYKLFKKKIVSWHNRAFIIFMKYTLNNYKIQLNFVLLYEPKYVNIYNFLINRLETILSISSINFSIKYYKRIKKFVFEILALYM